MSENRFKLGRVHYKAVPQKNPCCGCAFENDYRVCCVAPLCIGPYRSDGRNVIFVEDIQTNGDRIRAMSNEELAKFLEVNCSTPEKLWLDWLNSQAESEVKS